MKDSFLWQVATACFCVAAIGMGWAANHTNAYNDELWHENMKLRDSITWMESRWEAYQEIQSNEIHYQQILPMDSAADTAHIMFGWSPHHTPTDSLDFAHGRIYDITPAKRR